MSPKWRYFLGSVTIVSIVGVTIYAIKKSKDMKKTEESAISLEEAKHIMEQRRLAKMDKHTGEFEELVDDIRDTAGWNRSFMPDEDDRIEALKAKAEAEIEARRVISLKTEEDNEEEFEDEEELAEEQRKSDLASEEFMYTAADGILPKEDLELRHDPNSVEAKHQYIRMELSEWNPDDWGYHTLLKLFDFPFVPENDGDEMLRTQIIDFKVQFFGFTSKWVKDITIADIILHYARAAEFNCGESVRFWAEYFLDFNEFEPSIPSYKVDQLVEQLNSHTYFNEERATFGLFGLTRESMDSAIRIANRNVDRSVTYEIEFNEFLKSCV